MCSCSSRGAPGAATDGGALALPPAFLAQNRAEPAFLAALPGLVATLARRWSLTVGPHFPGIIYNYVAPATRADGTRAVLKLSRHVAETRNEIAALRLWDGDGAARLLAADEDAGALLLERIEPGTMLTEVARGDDEQATHIAAALLLRLRRRAPVGAGLRPLADWLGAYERNRATLSAGAGGFPPDLFLRADALRRDLLASAPAPMVLHGDLHHFNILRGPGDEWLAIDPKGLMGDPCFDVCQFLRNPMPEGVAPEVNRRRLAVFCAELGLDPERVRAWCFVHAVLDACWDFEDGNPWEGAVAWAETVLTF